MEEMDSWGGGLDLWEGLGVGGGMGKFTGVAYFHLEG